MTKVQKHRLYLDIVKVLRDQGHSRQRAIEIFNEIEGVFERHLVAGELHINGLVTVRVNAKKEQTYNGWTGRPVREKVVVRAGATVRKRLKAVILEQQDADVSGD